MKSSSSSGNLSPRSATAGGVRNVAKATQNGTQTKSKKSGTYMDEEGNLVHAPKKKNDFGEGFRSWVTNIEESCASGGGDSNSFLSRGTIMEFLQKKKEGKIGGDMHKNLQTKQQNGGNGANDRRSKSSSPHPYPIHQHNPKGQRRRGTMDHSLRSSTGANGNRMGKSSKRNSLPSRSKSMDGTMIMGMNGSQQHQHYDLEHLSELDQQLEHNHEAQKKSSKKKQAFKTQRGDPTLMKNHYAKRQYKIAMEPHHAADGIMR